MKNPNRIRPSHSDQVYYGIIGVSLFVLTLLVLYPLLYVLSASFSSAHAVNSGQVFLWPVDFTLDGYAAVFKNRNIGTGYANTVFYTLTGTAINVAITAIAAYPLSRKSLPFRKPLMLLFTFTMMFSGGMIPNYLLMMKLNLLNTRWALLLPGALSVYNMIIARTFLENIPGELHEAAEVDGCDDFRFFVQIALPLSGTMLAVIALFYAVVHWNSYFNAYLYLSERSLYPLQIVLREILVANTFSESMIVDPETMQAKSGMAELLKYALIIVSSVPVLALYPFLQKYFVKGVMIGSMKG